MFYYRLLYIILYTQLLLISTSQAQFSTWRKQFSGTGLTLGLNPLNPHTIVAEGARGSLYLSYDDGRTWNVRTPPGASDIRQIIIHPNDTNSIFVASGYRSMEGLRKSTDYGLTWKTVIYNFGIDGESVSFDMLHPDTMYAANFSPGNLFRSTDRGETWTHMGDAGDEACALAVRSDSSNILFSGSGGGTISKSVDAGVTWRVVKTGTAGTAFQEIPKIVVNALNPLIAYATTYGTIDTTLDVWKTTDGGEHWFRTSLQKVPTWALEVDQSNPEIVYAGTFTEDKSVVFKSTNGGGSWTELTSTLLTDGFMWSLKVHPMNPAALWLAMTEGVFGASGIYRYASTNTIIEGVVLDAATNDTVKNGYIVLPSTHDSINLFETSGKFTLGYIEGDSTLFPSAFFTSYPYFVKKQSLVFTPDSIRHQTILMERLPRISFTAGVESKSVHSPVHSIVTLSYSTLLGDSLRITETGDMATFTFDSLYIEYPPVIHYRELVVDPDLPYARTSVDGLPFGTVVYEVDEADVAIVQDSGSGDYSSYYTTALNQLGYTYNVWAVEEKGVPSLRQAQMLQKNLLIVPYGNKTNALSSSLHDSLLVAMNLGSHLLFSGQNFVEKNDSSELFVNLLGVRFEKNTTIIFGKGVPGDVFSGLQFFTVGSGGANNQNSRDVLLFDSSRCRPTMWYGPTSASGISAVRIDSLSGGGKAIVIGFGFEAITPDTMRKAVMSRMLGYFDSTNVLSVEGEDVPHGFMLEQNYPNPFNPVTVISYQLKVKSAVILKVYDVLGKEIATLMNEKKEAGKYSVRWNADGLPSGVYFYKLQAGEFSSVKKLLLMR
ncbi:MAG: T9SS type A sorting domain-containing protein [Ignavibacteriae bacterium]|nr:T9SS type A sorting domain-containing protein [Ignavibacteriota bacterium]